MNNTYTADELLAILEMKQRNHADGTHDIITLLPSQLDDLTALLADHYALEQRIKELEGDKNRLSSECIMHQQTIIQQKAECDVCNLPTANKVLLESNEELQRQLADKTAECDAAT